MSTLKQFYIEMQKWIDGGCGEHEIFRTYNSLCDTLLHWSSNGHALRKDMVKSFITAELNEKYPFNKNPDHWAGENLDATIYENPARLAWIKEHAA